MTMEVGLTIVGFPFDSYSFITSSHVFDIIGNNSFTKHVNRSTSASATRSHTLRDVGIGREG